MKPEEPIHNTLVLCIKNDGYEADLDVGTVYLTIPDEVAFERGRIRVVDESEEDYLYPKEFFIPVELSKPAKDVLSVG